jgi:hypothetical protein
VIAALSIARFEVSRRRGLLLGVFLVGLVPLAVLLLHEEPTKVSDTCSIGGVGMTCQSATFAYTCMLGAVVVSWIGAFVTGMSLVGTPLHDGRLAFYFTRPINAFAIATGKVAGGLVLVVVMELALIGPLLVVTESIDEMTVFVIGMTVVFLAVGLVVGIVARSRSRWFVADAVGATAASLVAVAMFGRINDVEDQRVKARWTWDQARPLIERAAAIIHWVEIAAVVAMFVAVVVAVGVGRTERERVHRVLSIALWSGVVATGLGGLAFAEWGLS